MERSALVLIAFLVVYMNSFSQDTTFKFIFVPHVRSEDATNQTVNPGIAKINFKPYSLKMLGGDLAQQTSKSEKTLKYLDSLFDLKNPNTLWSLGNHDLEQGDSNLIKKYTGRELYYSYYKDGVTFLVLNTEAAANGFTATYIKSPQLDTVMAVCERATYADTKFFVVLHSRYMWMVGNNDFTKSMKDSIAASSKSMTATNWYTDVEPQLQKVRAKGIKVLVFGGDKSQINVNYTKDSITYYAARMENTFTDAVNNVIVINYIKNKSMECNYVTLDHINDAADILPGFSVFAHGAATEKQALQVRQSVQKKEIALTWQGITDEPGIIQIFRINGALYCSKKCKANAATTVHVDKPDVYVAKAMFSNATHTKKFVVR